MQAENRQVSLAAKACRLDEPIDRKGGLQAEKQAGKLSKQRGKVECGQKSKETDT